MTGGNTDIKREKDSNGCKSRMEVFSHGGLSVSVMHLNPLNSEL